MYPFSIVQISGLLLLSGIIAYTTVHCVLVLYGHKVFEAHGSVSESGIPGSCDNSV